MNIPTNVAITEEDMDFIDSMLEKYGSDDSILNISELDGFLTAVVSGPEMIMPSEWLPAIWGGEEFLPKWEDEEEFARFFGLVTSLMNDIVCSLMDEPEEFKAMFLMDMEDGEPVEVVDLWCCGYVRAIAMHPESWYGLPEEIDERLSVIVAQGTDAGAEDIARMSDNEVATLKGMIEPAAAVIHAYWLEQRADMAPNAAPAPVVRAEPKVGRNDSCPCGSGKKFKHCCLH